MCRRLIASVGLGLVFVGAVHGQTDVRPTDLPPLLPVVPPTSAPPLPLVPTPPPITAYDPGYQYLPEQAPEQVRLADITESPGRWWAKTSLELAWTSTSSVPNSIKLRPPDALGRRVPSLHVPLGGNTFDPFRVGFGLNVGRWFGDEGMHALEGSFYFLGESRRTFDGFAPGTLVVFPQGPGHSAPVLIRLPHSLDAIGTTFPTTLSSWFAGGDVNYRVGLLIGASWRLDLLAGYRVAYLEDELYLGDLPRDYGDAYERDYRDDSSDDYLSNRIAAKSTFHGGQVGVSGEYRTETWYTEGVFKLAYGGVFTNTTATGVWLYSQPETVLHSDTQAAWLPTMNLRLGYRVSDHGRVFVGYSFHYLSHVARLGHAFSTGNHCDDFWTQSVNLGFDWRF